MLIFSKDEKLAVGLCMDCASKFATDGDLCWDCNYTRQAHTAVWKGSSLFIASTAWKTLQRIQ
jgi:predicted amidophosphoribosyltransferase